MKKKKIGFWIVTSLLAVGLFASGGASIAGVEQITGTMDRLGYPDYFPLIIGVAKVLAAVALISPRFPKIKEWAYAGATYVLGGAALSHLLAGDPFTMAIPPLVLLGLNAASYALRPDTREVHTAREPKELLAEVESEYGMEEGMESSAA